MKGIRCPVLVMTGDHSMYLDDAVDARAHLTMKQGCDWISIPLAGLLLTEEFPQALIEPMNLFINGLGYMAPDYHEKIFNSRYAYIK